MEIVPFEKSNGVEGHALTWVLSCSDMQMILRMVIMIFRESLISRFILEMPLDGRQLHLMLCVKCGFPADTFFEMSISEFCVESAGLLKMLSKPRHTIFAIMWKVWDSLKCF